MADKRPIIGPSQFSELTNSDGLIAGQSAVLSEQASSPGTPASGYGAIYAKTDGKVYFKNDAGTEYDLTATGGSGTDPIIREYTANDTWTKPTASNFWGALKSLILAQIERWRHALHMQVERQHGGNPGGEWRTGE